MSSNLTVVVLLGLFTIFHALVVLLIIFGGILAISSRLWRWPIIERIYLICVLSTIASQIIVGSCFLTDWDKNWRRMYLPETTYTGGFISHYLSYLGFHLNDWHVFYFMTFIMALGLITTVRHYWLSLKKKKSGN